MSAGSHPRMPDPTPAHAILGSRSCAMDPTLTSGGSEGLGFSEMVARQSGKGRRSEKTRGGIRSAISSAQQSCEDSHRLTTPTPAYRLATAVQIPDPCPGLSSDRCPDPCLDLCSDPCPNPGPDPGPVQILVCGSLFGSLFGSQFESLSGPLSGSLFGSLSGSPVSQSKRVRIATGSIATTCTSRLTT